MSPNGIWKKLLTLLADLLRRPGADLKVVGATLDWSPAEEVGEDSRLTRVMIANRLDPLSGDDVEWAEELLGLRERVDGRVEEWGRELDAYLDEWAPGWRADMPTVSFALVG